MVEVDFLSASQNKSADAILIRVGSFSYENPSVNDQKVVLIDSGYTECGKDIKEHLRRYYGTLHIDYVFITHPDRDHIAGFNALLDDKNVSIGHVYIHDPWEHCVEIFKKDKDGRRTRKSVERKIDEAFELLADVLDKLDEREISHSEIFAGKYVPVNGYNFNILGPSKFFYEECVKSCVLEENRTMTMGDDVYETSSSPASEVHKFFLDNPSTSPKNMSSMVILLSKKNGDPLFLFTGDAGVESLENAFDCATFYSVELCGLRRMQLPHHGSIKNVSRNVLTCFEAESYVVSASIEEEQHPSKLLINYVVGKLGKPVLCATEDYQLCLRFDSAPSRGWGTAQKMEKFLTLKKLKGDV